MTCLTVLKSTHIIVLFNVTLYVARELLVVSAFACCLLKRIKLNTAWKMIFLELLQYHTGVNKYYCFNNLSTLSLQEQVVDVGNGLQYETQNMPPQR